MIDVPDPSTRKKRGVAAEEQAIGSEHAQGPFENSFERQARFVLDPAVRTRRVEQNVRAQISDHQRLAKESRTKMRDDDRNGRIRHRKCVEVEGIAQANIEQAWQTQL